MEAVDALAQLGGTASYSVLMRHTTARRFRTALARRDVADQAHAGAAIPFESVLRSTLLGAGFDLVPQFEVRVGRDVFRPDLADPLAGVVVEADSWTFHSDREAFERDRRRYTLLTADGWRVLRFTYEQVMHRPGVVRRCVAATYGHAPLDTPSDAATYPRVAGRVAGRVA